MRSLLMALLLAMPLAGWGSVRDHDFNSVIAQSLLEFPEELRDAAKAGKRVVVYFEQENCPICRHMVQTNFSQKDIVDALKRNFVVVPVDVWGARDTTWVDGKARPEKELAAHLGVRFTPVLFFLDERGGVVLRANGYMPPHEFRAALAFVAGKMEAKTTFPAYYASQPRPAAAKTLARQAFFDARADARPRGRPTAILFESTECYECDQLHGEGFRDADVLKQVPGLRWVRMALHGQETVVAPDGASVTAAGLAKAMRVTTAPTMVFLDGAGKEVFRLDGYPRAWHLASALEYVASGAWRNEPQFMKYMQLRAERHRSEGKDVRPFGLAPGAR
jgi:thioredoxin-related protein